MTPQVPVSHYNAHYDSKRRFISYWHQIQEILRRAGGPVLEIGVGNGMVSSYLRKQGVQLTTIDYDANLAPDVVGNATKLPFPDASFDLVAAYEVLEHMPYEESRIALREIRRVTKRLAVISLPDSARSYYIEFRLPFVGIHRVSWRFTLFTKTKSPIAQHLWELGLRDFPLQRFRQDIEHAGFCIEKEYAVPENPRHYFFVLKAL